MHPGERLGLAHLSYRRALAEAKGCSSPVTWRRLLTAAKNLDAARRDRRRARGAPPERPQDAQPPPPMGKVLRLRSRRVWHDLLAEWERSRQLMDEARSAVRRAAELRERRSRERGSRPDQPGT